MGRRMRQCGAVLAEASLTLQRVQDQSQGFMEQTRLAQMESFAMSDDDAIDWFESEAERPQLWNQTCPSAGKLDDPTLSASRQRHPSKSSGFGANSTEAGLQCDSFTDLTHADIWTDQWTEDGTVLSQCSVGS